MSDPTKMHRFVIGFRIAVIGITMAGLGAAWNWDILWLFVLSLVFGGEELVESTVHLYILRRGRVARLRRSVQPSATRRCHPESAVEGSSRV